MWRTWRRQSWMRAVRRCSALWVVSAMSWRISSIIDFSAQVQVDVAGLSAGANGGDDGQGECFEPELMLVGQIVDVVLLDGVEPGKRLHPVELCLQALRGIEIGLEKSGVGGVLVAAKSGLFVQDELFDAADLRDAGVGFLDELNGRIGSLNLQIEGHCSQQKSDDRQ